MQEKGKWNVALIYAAEKGAYLKGEWMTSTEMGMLLVPWTYVGLRFPADRFRTAKAGSVIEPGNMRPLDGQVSQALVGANGTRDLHGDKEEQTGKGKCADAHFKEGSKCLLEGFLGDISSSGRSSSGRVQGMGTDLKCYTCMSLA
uniref:Uncharacterized protein n=1 Tax=Steinernema glaseri TaxID=37863 RepID=A0A1I8AHA9_9BILA